MAGDQEEVLRFSRYDTISQTNRRRHQGTRAPICIDARPSHKPVGLIVVIAGASTETAIVGGQGCRIWSVMVVAGAVTAVAYRTGSG